MIKSDSVGSFVSQAKFFNKLASKFSKNKVGGLQSEGPGGLANGSEQGDVGAGGTAAANGGKVEMLISCTDLVDLDVFSKSDPMCVLFVRQFGQWKEYARTEAVENASNPKFTESFMIDYNPDTIQHLRFSVYDIDCRSMDLRKHDFVGSVETTLTSLFQNDTAISTSSFSLRVPGDSKVRGNINITVEYVKETRSKAYFQLGGSKLDKKGLFSIAKSDTYLEVCRSVNSVNFHPVYRSEVVSKSQNPTWKQFDLSIQKLVNGDLERPIQFAIWHYEKNGNHVILGECITFVQELYKYRGKSCQNLPVLEPNKVNKKSYKDSGNLKIFLFRLDMQYSLLDYVMGGCRIKFMAAVDFTASNGNKNHTSLHCTDGENPYIDALKSVGSILSHYDLEGRFPAFGFGAKLLPKKKKVDHCFALNGNLQSPEVKGMQGLLDAYRDMIPKLRFAGPTYFTPVLQQVMNYMSKKTPSQSDQFYYILLIITDGIVNDLDETIDAITESSSLPLSVFIVGVGPADFSMMDELIQSDQHTQKKSSKRCNVHFSAFPVHSHISPFTTAIAQEALATVSSQIVSYMKEKDISPNKSRLHRTDPVDTTTTEPHRQQKTRSKSAVINGHKIFTSYTGPVCPTCGSSIEPGAEPPTNSYKET